jgi:DNA modification methylase
MKYQILQGDNRETLKTIPDNSIDAIVTDPPYGIDFLGKAWDANTGALETYQECLRVLKPGGHILAFSAARTYHHLAITLEQAGFEIRDQIMWIYSSGFPKSQDVGKSIDRSAGKKANNVLKAPTFNTNGEKIVSNSANGQLRCPKCLKTSEARYHCNQGQDCGMIFKPQTEQAKQWQGWGTALKPAHEPIALARKPLQKNLSIAKTVQQWGTGAINIDATRVEGDRFPSNVIGDIEEQYQKYFYCPKVSRKERHIGFEDPGPMFQGSRTDIYQPNKNSPDIQITSAENKAVPQNNHPTVKPVALMEYLIKLITPPGGTVLDPFNGSGSTGMAATGLGYDYIGCELDPAYVAISEQRIAAWLDRDAPDNNFKELFLDVT